MHCAIWAEPNTFILLLTISIIHHLNYNFMRPHRVYLDQHTDHTLTPGTPHAHASLLEKRKQGDQKFYKIKSLIIYSMEYYLQIYPPCMPGGEKLEIFFFFLKKIINFLWGSSGSKCMICVLVQIHPVRNIKFVNE